MILLRALFKLTVAAGSLACAHAAIINWSSFTGGGGISHYGSTAVGGAIGAIAPAPWQATGGSTTLTGGFWSVLSDQPRLASPVLSIVALGGEKVVLSWPVALQGFVLEYTTDHGSGVWVIEGTQVVDTFTDHTVTIGVQDAFRCYRLRSQ